MEDIDEDDKISLGAIALFGIIIALVIAFRPELLDLDFYQWLLVFGATFGLSRIVSKESVFEPIRDLSRLIHLDELVSCPRCIGVWAALFIAISIAALGQPALFVAALLSVAGANIAAHAVLSLFVEGSNALSRAGDKKTGTK